MKQIYKINNKISICADRLQYIVRIAQPKKKKTSKQGYEYWYYPTITMCFQDVYETLLKEKLTLKVQKDIDSIKAIYLEALKEIKHILKSK